MEHERNNVRRLMVSINRIDGIQYMLARKSGLKINTLSLLFALDDGQARTQKQICEEWIIPKTTINTVVKECVENGLVELLPKENSKEKLVCLTTKGQKYAQEVLELFYQIENAAMAEVLAEYSPQFIQAVEYYADCLKNKVDQVNEKSK